MLYAILNESLDMVIDIRVFDELPPHKPGRVLPLIDDIKPSYDEETEKIITGDYVIDDGVVRQTWIVVELTEQELEEKKLENIDRIKGETNSLYNTLPAIYRAMFAPLYVAVKDFLSRGDFEAARLVISNQEVPPELEDIKNAILNEIPEISTLIT